MIEVSELINEKFALIGLHGIAENNGERIGSKFVGKDAVADRLVKDFYYYKDFFANPIYGMMECCYGVKRSNLISLTVEEKDHKIVEPWGKTIRQLMQGLGDKFRGEDPDFYIKSLDLRLKDIGLGKPQFMQQGIGKSSTLPIIISDVRMENEAEYIRGLGGTIIHIHREFEVEGYPAQTHNTEAGIEIKPDDVHFYNNGSIDDLKFDLCRMLVSDLQVKTFGTKLND